MSPAPMCLTVDKVCLYVCALKTGITFCDAHGPIAYNIFCQR